MRRLLPVALVVLAITPFSFGRVGRNVGAGAAQTQCNQTFITESLPDFTVGQPVNYQIEVCCGTPPYRFAITGGALPDGLHMNQNGKITGKPTMETDTTVFVTLTDGAGCTLTQAFAARAVVP